MRKTISEIAKLFNLSVSTLHYWEQTGLFHIKRNKENRYRSYGISDIFSIWEIILYREIGIPIKKIEQLLSEDSEGMAKVYDESEARLQKEIFILEQRLKKLEQQKRLLAIKARLEKQPMTLGEPNLMKCHKDPFTEETIKRTLEDPYECIVFYDHKTECFERGICLEEEKSELLWCKGEEDKKYLECLLKVNAEQMADNNLEELKAEASALGYQTGDVIARYLLIATSEGVRYEYYHGWLEIIE